MVNPVLVENSQDLDNVGRIGSADEATPTKPLYVLFFSRFRYFQSRWQEIGWCGENDHWERSNMRQCQIRVRFESGVKKKFLAALNQLLTPKMCVFVTKMSTFFGDDIR